MLRRAVCQTASNVYQPRPASPDRGHGVRRGAWVRRSEFASSFDSPVTSSSRSVASLLRRTGVDVCRLHVRSPGPWHSIPRALSFACARGMPVGSLCDAGLTRRAPGTGPPTLRHGPPGLAPDIRSDEGRRRRRQRRWRLVGAALDRVLLVDRCLRLLTFDPCGRLGRGSAHVCAALCRSVDLVINVIHM